MAKKSCSTHSRLAALSHLPLSWQLPWAAHWRACPCRPGRRLRRTGAGSATHGVIEQGEAGQRLGRAIEHQQADQQQESCRRALLQNHARPVHQDGHILAGNGGWGKPGWPVASGAGRFCLANACSLKGDQYTAPSQIPRCSMLKLCPCAAAGTAARLLVPVRPVALSGAPAPPEQRLCLRPHVSCGLPADRPPRSG